MPTAGASSITTSKAPTSSSRRKAWSKCWISAWRGAWPRRQTSCRPRYDAREPARGERHAVVHGAGSAARRAGRCQQRLLGARSRALRGGVGAGAVPGEDGVRDQLRHPPGNAAAAARRATAGLWSIVQRALAKEPAQRYQRASEVQAALEAVQSVQRRAQPTSQPRDTPRSCSRGTRHLQVNNSDVLLLVGTTKGAFFSSPRRRERGGMSPGRTFTGMPCMRWATTAGTDGIASGLRRRTSGERSFARATITAAAGRIRTRRTSSFRPSRGVAKKYLADPPGRPRPRTDLLRRRARGALRVA